MKVTLLTTPLSSFPFFFFFLRALSNDIAGAWWRVGQSVFDSLHGLRHDLQLSSEPCPMRVGDMGVKGPEH
jgi:hypothetical protein